MHMFVHVLHCHVIVLFDHEYVWIMLRYDMCEYHDLCLDQLTNNTNVGSYQHIFLLLADQIEQNESLKSELDDIVSGLQGYLEGVKGQSVQHRQDFQMLLQEKEALEEKVRRLEAELSILDTEAQNAKILQKVGGLFTECQNSAEGGWSFHRMPKFCRRWVVFSQNAKILRTMGVFLTE